MSSETNLKSLIRHQISADGNPNGIQPAALMLLSMKIWRMMIERRGENDENDENLTKDY